jgi:hypothetical protein
MFAIIFGITVQASAVEIKEAMIVSFSGLVEIFSALNVDPNATGKSFVIYDGKKYASRRVQSGVKVHPGDILRSGNDGKMKIIYDNGDVFILGSATAFIIPSVLKKGAAAEVSSELLYGKLRGMIDHKGPLSGIRVKTQSITSGVRGTDFYIVNNPVSMKTEVHVLRGDVEVSPTNEKGGTQSPVHVKTGQKAQFEEAPQNTNTNQTKAPEIKVLLSSQSDLKQIQASTTTPAPNFSEMKPEEKAKIEELQKVSQEMVKADIQAVTPDVYKALQAQKVSSIEDISNVMIQDLSKKAPKGATKPRLSDFNESDDIYKKYFKPTE